MTDFQARIERVLKEMQALVAQVDPNQALEFGTFPEVFVNNYMQTLVQYTSSAQFQLLSTELGFFLKPLVGSVLS